MSTRKRPCKRLRKERVLKELKLQRDSKQRRTITRFQKKQQKLFFSKKKKKKKKKQILVRGSAPPSSILDKTEFGSYDESGYPLTLADGSEIPKARQKTLKKAWTAQETAHKKFLAKAKGDADAILAEGKRKVAALEEELAKFK